MSNVPDKISNVQEHVAGVVESAREAAHSLTNKVTDFFQGNPNDTIIGRKIEVATDASTLATENWGLNMEICDFINSTTEGGRDAIRAIRKRLQTQIGKNNAIVMYTLTLLETCVKNCDQRFKALVCNKDFINELIKLIGAKFDAPQIIQERVLSLIQCWADAFRGNSALVGVVEVYDELKTKGVEFPPLDFDSLAPILTPRRTVFPEKSPNSLHTPVNEIPLLDSNSPAPSIPFESINGPVTATPEQLSKLRKDLDVVSVNITVLCELLGGLTPNRETSEEFSLLQQLCSTSKEMQKRILELIQQVSNEEVAYELLTVNDELNNTFDKYKRYMINRSSQGGPSSAPAADLIDFGRESSSSLTNEVEPVSSKQINSEDYIHDQTNAGIHKVAFNKTQEIKEREGNQKATNLEKAEKPIFDDGL